MRVDDRPFVSIIMPCRQEKEWIGPCLDSVLANDYPKDRLEILVVDGMSDDGTREIVATYIQGRSYLRLIDNPRRTTPTALNTGLRLAAGDVIVRMDAHVLYPRDYISNLVGWLVRSGADNVGGHCVSRPASDSGIARAIAVALSHPFGVGNAYFRTGIREPRFVDTVPFGCYPRAVFERVGLFDEELVRNQDDEFNLRLVKAGGRILLIPGIRSEYVARDSLRKIARMYFQYGYYKPLAAVKLRGVFTLRQLVPPVFVLGVVGLGALGVLAPAVRLGFFGLVAAYLVALAVAGVTAKGSGDWLARVLLCAVFPVLHFSYGFGYLAGVAGLFMRQGKGTTNGARLALTR